jgi:hypothetical protein
LKPPGHAADAGVKAADLARRSRRDGEAELRRARLGQFIAEAQEKAGDLLLPCAKGSATRRRKVERRLSELADRNTEAAAGKCCLEGPERL